MKETLGLCGECHQWLPIQAKEGLPFHLNQIGKDECGTAGTAPKATRSVGDEKSLWPL